MRNLECFLEARSLTVAAPLGIALRFSTNDGCVVASFRTATERERSEPECMSNSYPIQLDTTGQNPPLPTAIYTATGRLMDMRRNAVATVPQFEELREHASAVKRHTIGNLDHYLEQVERNVEAHGGKVVFAQDATEVADFILSLAKQKGAKLFVKSKSMTTEEIHLNSRLEAHQLEAVETDLGEYILQLADERPYHIIAPALHYTRYDVARIFEKKLGRSETEPSDQSKIERAVLRQKFLDADIGITGANFVVADSGAVVIVENEGYARLTHSAPKIHIAIAGIEKIITRAQDLAVFLALLGPQRDRSGDVGLHVVRQRS